HRNPAAARPRGEKSLRSPSPWADWIPAQGRDDGGRVALAGSWHHPKSGAQHAARSLDYIGDDLASQRLEVLVGQGLVDRLDQHFDGDRLAAFTERGTLEDVEDIDAGDQLAVGARCGLDDRPGLHAAVDHEG